MTLTGIAYPLQVENGTLKTATDADYVQGLIISYLETYLGERLGLETTYGIPDYSFKAYRAFGFAGKDIEAKLAQSIPQATFSVVSTINDGGEGEIFVYWSFDGSDQTPLTFTLETGVNNG